MFCQVQILQISYKHFERNKNFPKQVFGKQHPKICKSFCLRKFDIIYLNVYKSKCVLARRFILLYSFILSKCFNHYGFEDYTNPLLLWIFSRTKQFHGYLSYTNLKRKGRVPMEKKWSCQVKCLVQQLPKVLSWENFDFYGVVNLKMLSDPDVHTKPQPQSPCAFIKISLYFANPKLYSMQTSTLRNLSKFRTIIVMISHLKKFLCGYKKTLLDV